MDRWDVLTVARRGLTSICLLLAVVVGVLHEHRWRRLKVLPAPDDFAVEPVAFSFSLPISAREWGTFRPCTRRATGGAPGAGARYRLAGTFVVLGDSSAVGEGMRLRKAILDDLDRGAQILVGEGESLGTVRVERVWADRVLLNADGETIELRLTYRGGAAGASDAAAAAESVEPEESAALEVSRFGRRVAETRWELSRSALMDYYREMLDEPERIARIYETFEPDYTPERRIAGYRIAIKGEEDFLHAVGLREGDVVRAVNSLNMTSQSRAEFFLREFAQGRLDTVVMEIEREGAPQKLVYLIR